MKQFFKSLDPQNSGFIQKDQIEEVLITLGLCKDRENMDEQISILNKDVDNQLDFETFLQLLKQTSAIGNQNKNQIPNFLLEKNVLGEQVKEERDSSNSALKLPQL